jgi:hypothetical protein
MYTADWSRIRQVKGKYIYIWLDPRRLGNFSYTCEFKTIGIRTYNFIAEPFYIGIGAKKRFKDPQGRNKGVRLRFNKIEKEMGRNPIVFILRCDNRTLLERILIRTIGRKDEDKGPLLNRTNGGSGVHGHIYTREQRERMSKSKKGKKRWPHSKKTKRRMSENSAHYWLGKKQPKEHRKKNSDGQRKVWQDPEYRKRQSNSQKKYWSNPKHRKRQSRSLKGKKNAICTWRVISPRGRIFLIKDLYSLIKEKGWSPKIVRSKDREQGIRSGLWKGWRCENLGRG